MPNLSSKHNKNCRLYSGYGLVAHYSVLTDIQTKYYRFRTATLTCLFCSSILIYFFIDTICHIDKNFLTKLDLNVYVPGTQGIPAKLYYHDILSKFDKKNQLKLP